MPGAVAVEAVGDDQALLEVVGQREVEERSLVGGELHARGQAALDDGEVAGGEVAVEVGHVGPDLEAVGCGSVAGSMRGPATTIMRSAGTLALAPGRPR